jgi:hypothetical protein
MLSISLDFGRVPSVLAALSDARNAQLMVNAAAERYVDDTHDWIDADKAFTPHTGQLQQSINWRPAGNGSAEVYANAKYAGYVEHGTDAHVIAPKSGRKGLKIPVSGGGGYIVRRKVNHPGSKPHPYFFADQGNRTEHMLAAGLSVLAVKLAQAGARG